MARGFRLSGRRRCLPRLREAELSYHLGFLCTLPNSSMSQGAHRRTCTPWSLNQWVIRVETRSREYAASRSASCHGYFGHVPRLIAGSRRSPTPSSTGSQCIPTRCASPSERHTKQQAQPAAHGPISQALFSRAGRLADDRKWNQKAPKVSDREPRLSRVATYVRSVAPYERGAGTRCARMYEVALGSAGELGVARRMLG